ncbi:MAG TPA: monofunctional biosynthetic peptidoglycan transglycosylase [Deltaproteobacteria bacterium]|jgi:monofunctional biosynthetic peptidoglycan transglycosylase|nr:monofunctional biosynthetic peptidoglycan transglycosylase [Deltaproteobacteria bacterium]HOI05581.1 monofunctional biosynthetic peptidoglycan transglycosylase [Deltaproteobacteria bacterium]
MLKKLLLYALLASMAFVLGDIALCFVYPDVQSLRKEHFEKTAFMRYRERQWEKEGRDKKIVHTWVPLKKVSPYLIKAIIIAEDDKFYRHEGFDFKALQRAFEEDLKKRKFSAGGSTISQQLAKNLFLSPSKTPLRKIKEAIYTWRLEKNLSKKRIVELYVNAAEWGDGIFGIQAASRHYYGKNASALTAPEAARLASVLPNPIRYNPTGSKRYVLARSKAIYRIMLKRGIVIPEYEEVMHAPEEPEAVEEGLENQADTTGIEPPSSEEEGDAEALAGTESTTGAESPAEGETPDPL